MLFLGKGTQPCMLNHQFHNSPPSASKAHHPGSVMIMFRFSRKRWPNVETSISHSYKQSSVILVGTASWAEMSHLNRKHIFKFSGPMALHSEKNWAPIFDFEFIHTRIKLLWPWYPHRMHWMMKPTQVHPEAGVPTNILYTKRNEVSSMKWMLPHWYYIDILSPEQTSAPNFGAGSLPRQCCRQAKQLAGGASWTSLPAVGKKQSDSACVLESTCLLKSRCN